MTKGSVQQTVEVPTAEVTAKLATQVEALAAKIAIIEQALSDLANNLNPPVK